MENKIIFTIARQFGSGGRAVGKLLAEKLGIPFYDKSLLQMAAKDSGLDESLFESADEKPSNRFWNAAASSTNVFGNRISVFQDMPMNDKLFLFQSDIIKKIAEKGSCVIVGRCADYILRDETNIVHVFVHSSEEDKLNRMIHQYGVPAEKAKETMMKTDKNRSSYYNYYTDGKWGRADTYDLSLNSGSIGIEGAAEMIMLFARMKYKAGE